MGVPTGSIEQRLMLRAFGAKWPRTRCELCKDRSASGLFLCTFSTFQKAKALCAYCGLYYGYKKWTGFFGPKLITIKLLCSITSPVPPERLALVRRRCMALVRQ